MRGKRMRVVIFAASSAELKFNHTLKRLPYPFLDERRAKIKLEVGEELDACDPFGQWYLARVLQVDKNSVLVTYAGCA